MRKFLAFAILVIFSLNIFGYYGIFLGVRMQWSEQIREQFNVDSYSMHDEVTFKIPLTLPYPNEANVFERVDGEFTHEGETYRLVKQKLYRDTLHIVCYKDNRTQSIDKALADIVKTFSDNTSKEKSQVKSVVSFSKDFFSTTIGLANSQAAWESLISWNQLPSAKTSAYHPRLIQPPQA